MANPGRRCTQRHLAIASSIAVRFSAGENVSMKLSHVHGVPLHIVQRGHNRAPCFFDEDDYSSCLHWLGEALQPSY